MAARKRSTARTAVLPARESLSAGSLARFAPSARSLIVGLVVLALGFGCYFAARATSIFAVRMIEIRGGSPALQAQVRKTIAGEMGRSLLVVDGEGLTKEIAPVPGVRSFAYDRAFPNTLRLVIRPELPVLVLRRAAGAYLVAATGRVIRPLTHPRLSSLPRLWVTRDVRVRIGERLPRSVARAATTLAALRAAPLPGGVASVKAGKELTLVLGGGLEVRLGDQGDLQLKLAIARRILRTTGATLVGDGYLDVSVPERPVLSLKSQVGG